MDALVLAAGLGTRLRPLTDLVPKPAVPVANRPLIAFALEHLGRAGVRRLAINTHHLGEQLAPIVQTRAPPGVEARLVHEPELLGTGGGVRNLWLSLRGEAGEEPIAVMNADVVFAPDLAGALALHRRLDAVATMVLRQDPDARRYGAVDIDAEDRVRRLLGLPLEASGDPPLRTLMFTGVSILSPRALAALPASGCIIKNSYRRWIDGGETVAGFVEDAPWRDLGTLAQYLAANVDLASGDLSWPGVIPSPDGVLLGPGARIGKGARLRATNLGAGSSVGAGADLCEVVVWPGAHAEGTLHRAVVTPAGVVAVPG